MSWSVGATPAVIKAREKCRTRGVVAGFERLVEQLRADPRFVPPDKKEIWGRAWPDVPNHRHADLPSAWRSTWTIRRHDGGELVTILFLGTHEEYEELYGFRKQ